MKEFLMVKDWHSPPCACGKQGSSEVCRKVSKGREMPGKASGINTQPFRAYFHPDPNPSDFHRAVPKTFVQDQERGS